MSSRSIRGKSAATGHGQLQQQKQSSPTFALGGSPQLRMKAGPDPVTPVLRSRVDNMEKFQDGIQVAQLQEGAAQEGAVCEI